LLLKIGRIQVQIDLGAERLIAAEKEGEQIAVEIKTFGNVSFITALYEAVGKYIIYRIFFEFCSTEQSTLSCCASSHLCRILCRTSPETSYG
jgi:hypothetical protein